VLVALTGGQKLGLALAAAVFIAFALASAMLIPRRRPDFPGAGGLKLFVAVTVLLVLGMLTAVAVLAREDEEGEAHEGEAAAETRAAETRAAETQAAETRAAETQAAETAARGGASPAGDAEAGADVFASSGCGGCHALDEAGSSGQIGPDLDQARPDRALVIERVTNGKGVMPAFGDELTEKEIVDVAAFVVQATQ
jgi:mono/diheme cytochrome c family protein